MFVSYTLSKKVYMDFILTLLLKFYKITMHKNSFLLKQSHDLKLFDEITDCTAIKNSF